MEIILDLLLLLLLAPLNQQELPWAFPNLVNLLITDAATTLLNVVIIAITVVAAVLELLDG